MEWLTEGTSHGTLGFGALCTRFRMWAANSEQYSDEEILRKKLLGFLGFKQGQRTSSLRFDESVDGIDSKVPNVPSLTQSKPMLQVRSSIPASVATIVDAPFSRTFKSPRVNPWSHSHHQLQSIPGALLIHESHAWRIRTKTFDATSQLYAFLDIKYLHSFIVSCGSD